MDIMQVVLNDSIRVLRAILICNSFVILSLGQFLTIMHNKFLLTCLFLIVLFLVYLPSVFVSLNDMFVSSLPWHQQVHLIFRPCCFFEIIVNLSVCLDISIILVFIPHDSYQYGVQK